MSEAKRGVVVDITTIDEAMRSFKNPVSYQVEVENGVSWYVIVAEGVLGEVTTNFNLASIISIEIRQITL